jgi:Flp pilus assembly protein TadG
MRKNKGQSLVEFALILPLFLFLVFAIIYCGMLFHDYSALSSIARSAAREAAIMTEVPETSSASSEAHYGGVETFYFNQTQNTLTTLYKTQKVNVEHKIKDGEAYVVVRIHMVRTITSILLETVTPPTFDIVYFMKKDTPTASNSGS